MCYQDNRMCYQDNDVVGSESSQWLFLMRLVTSVLLPSVVLAELVQLTRLYSGLDNISNTRL